MEIVYRQVTKSVCRLLELSKMFFLQIFFDPMVGYIYGLDPNMENQLYLSRVMNSLDYRMCRVLCILHIYLKFNVVIGVHMWDFYLRISKRQVVREKYVIY